MSIFNKNVLDELKKCRDRINALVPSEKLEQMWVGTPANKWFESLKTSWQIESLPTSSLNRNGLLALVADTKQSSNFSKDQIQKLIISIFSWGGMSRTRTTGQLAMDSMEAYVEICRSLLLGSDPLEAYQSFYNKQIAGSMRGVGPAYYTKLIFFLGDQKGLIMDQWTARSMNILLKEPIIKLEGGYKGRFAVSKFNSQIVYKKYLEALNELTKELGISDASKTEELIFSCSHEQAKIKTLLGEFHEDCSAWRRYVVANS